MFARSIRTLIQWTAAFVLIGAWVGQSAHAIPIDPTDPRQLTYICCGTGDPTTTDFKSLDVTYPVNITAVTLPTAPAGCQVVTAGDKAIVDCTNKLAKGDKITVSIDPVNNGNVSACWDPVEMCITNAPAASEPSGLLVLAAGIAGVLATLRRRNRRIR